MNPSNTASSIACITSARSLNVLLETHGANRIRWQARSGQLFVIYPDEMWSWDASSNDSDSLESSDESSETSTSRVYGSTVKSKGNGKGKGKGKERKVRRSRRFEGKDPESTGVAEVDAINLRKRPRPAEESDDLSDVMDSDNESEDIPPKKRQRRMRVDISEETSVKDLAALVKRVSRRVLYIMLSTAPAETRLLVVIRASIRDEMRTKKPAFSTRLKNYVRDNLLRLDITELILYLADINDIHIKASQVPTSENGDAMNVDGSVAKLLPIDRMSAWSIDGKMTHELHSAIKRNATTYVELYVADRGFGSHFIRAKIELFRLAAGHSPDALDVFLNYGTVPASEEEESTWSNIERRIASTEPAKRKRVAIDISSTAAVLLQAAALQKQWTSLGILLAWNRFPTKRIDPRITITVERKLSRKELKARAAIVKQSGAIRTGIEPTTVSVKERFVETLLDDDDFPGLKRVAEWSGSGGLGGAYLDVELNDNALFRRACKHEKQTGKASTAILYLINDYAHALPNCATSLPPQFANVVWTSDAERDATLELLQTLPVENQQVIYMDPRIHLKETLINLVKARSPTALKALLGWRGKGVRLFGKRIDPRLEDNLAARTAVTYGRLESLSALLRWRGKGELGGVQINAAFDSYALWNALDVNHAIRDYDHKLYNEMAALLLFHKGQPPDFGDIDRNGPRIADLRYHQREVKRRGNQPKKRGGAAQDDSFMDEASLDEDDEESDFELSVDDDFDDDDDGGENAVKITVPAPQQRTRQGASSNMRAVTALFGTL